MNGLYILMHNVSVHWSIAVGRVFNQLGASKRRASNLSFVHLDP